MSSLHTHCIQPPLSPVTEPQPCAYILSTSKAVLLTFTAQLKRRRIEKAARASDLKSADHSLKLLSMPFGKKVNRVPNPQHDHDLRTGAGNTASLSEPTPGVSRQQNNYDHSPAGTVTPRTNSQIGLRKNEDPQRVTNSRTTNSTNKAGSNAESKVNQNLDPVQSALRQARNAEDSSNYAKSRTNLLDAETNALWDGPARVRASEIEQHAQRIVFKIREHERIGDLFGNVPSEKLPPETSRDMGGRFLLNLDRIKKSKVFAIARQMPKGAHQHVHFNSELQPEVLFPHARELKTTMFVRSSAPLCSQQAFDSAEIVFNVLPEGTKQADIFSKEYNPATKDNSPWMLWDEFRKRFPKIKLVKPVPEQIEGLKFPEVWARQKMVVTADRKHQTHNGAWACFNQGTRAFKGLVGYESVYRWYIGEAIQSMIDDKVMYAELRPMLMDKTIPSDDGKAQLDHKDQMNIICEEVRKKKKELSDKGQKDKFPFGLKIIYCTPRSIPKDRMETELADCIRLKQQFPDLICGFDLVGAEDRPNCINYYAELLLAFTETCKALNIEIPFMFHAGETLLDTGGSHHPENSNLYDSLLLHAKRIGHGYALLKHPTLIEKYKEANISLELCPISNELLQLCGNAREHPFPQLLAAGLHCTLNADNPSLFR